MSEELLNNEAQVRAMKQLLRHYQVKEFVDECPLCSTTLCGQCVWTTQTKTDCVRYYEAWKKRRGIEGRGLGHARNMLNNLKWNRFRIIQLKRWIKKYEKFNINNTKR